MSASSPQWLASSGRQKAWCRELRTKSRRNALTWADHICNTTLGGAAHAERRSLFKNLLKSAWDFTNWLTHTKRPLWRDAEAAVTNLVIRHVRKVPETCPACGSHRLSPERGLHTGIPNAVSERPICDKCG